MTPNIETHTSSESEPGLVGRFSGDLVRGINPGRPSARVDRD